MRHLILCLWMFGVTQIVACGIGVWHAGTRHVSNFESRSTFGGCSLLDDRVACNTTIIDTCAGWPSCAGSCPYVCSGLPNFFPDTSAPMVNLWITGVATCGSIGDTYEQEECDRYFVECGCAFPSVYNCPGNIYRTAPSTCAPPGS